jgi:hypothetical protein
MTKKRGLASFMKSSVYLRGDITSGIGGKRTGSKFRSTKTDSAPPSKDGSGLWVYNTDTDVWCCKKINSNTDLGVMEGYLSFFPRSYDLEDMD